MEQNKGLTPLSLPKLLKITHHEKQGGVGRERSLLLLIFWKLETGSWKLLSAGTPEWSKKTS
jgi:hypothetical protein